MKTTVAALYISALLILFCGASAQCFVPVTPIMPLQALPTVPLKTAPATVTVTEDELRVEILIKLGDVAVDSDNYESAVAFYQTALKYLGRTSYSSAKLSYIAGGLSIAYCGLGDMVSALKYAHESVSAALANRPRDRVDISISYNNLAFLYKKCGSLALAEKTYESAIAYMPLNDSDDRLRAAAILCNLGDVYSSNNKLQKCLFTYKQALSLLRRELPGDHPAIKEVEEKIRQVMRSSKVTAS